jgi:uncharacterized cupin superfamily protein
MSSEQKMGPLLTKDVIEASMPGHVRHPFNDKSDVYIKPLSRVVGLERVSLSLARVPPGKESFVFHRHERDEEFIYILSGRGRAEIGDEVFDVGPGDFMGFRAPDGPPHQLINPYEEDLVYLMGGESSGYDIGHFPRLGRHIIFSGGAIQAIDDGSIENMNLGDFMVKEEGSGD